MTQRVLVLEPSSLYRRLISHILEEKGLEVVCETYPDRALSALRAGDGDFAFVTLAYHMEDHSCEAVCRQIRAALPDTHLPILVLTTETDHGVVTRLLSSGATEVFSKQNLDKFYEYIEHHLLLASRQQLDPGEVLLIEDDRAMACIVKEVMADARQTVEHYLTAEEGLSALMKAPRRFDLVITDVILPGEMNALAFISQIRRHDALDDLPILVMSGIEDINTRLTLLNEGANDFISKPFHVEELRVRTLNLIRSKRLLDQVREQQRKLHELAMRDQLTGLYNRHFLTENVALRMSEARRHGYDLSLIIADIDHFKSINDTHGHDVGDRVLVAVSEYLSSQARKEDVVARMGGEEFMLLLCHCNVDNAEKRAEHIRAGIEALKPEGHTVTMSFGVTGLTPDETSFQAIYKRADLALYQAKHTGRNRVCRMPGHGTP